MSLTKAVSVGTEGQEEVLIPAVREALIDFGASALKHKTFTVTDADVAPGMLILVGHSAEAAPGRDQDENEMDTLFLRAVAGTGEFTVYATAHPNRVSGAFYINYVLR